MEEARELFSSLMHTIGSNVAIIPSASYGVQTAANNLHIPEKSKIIVLSDQFPSNVYPWRRIAIQKNAKIETVNVPDGEASTQYIIDALDEQVSVCATANVLWTNGSLIDLEKVKAKCSDCDTELVVDLTQSAGAFDIDLSKIDPAFAIVANYKWMLCPYTTGFLYVGDEHLDGRPLEEGWVTRKGGRNFSSLTENPETFELGAVRYDMGERANFALNPGVNRALEQLLDWGVENIERTLGSRNATLCERLDALGLKTTKAANRGAHFIGAQIPEKTRDDLLTALAKDNVFLSVRNGSLRITPHLWNDDQDFDHLINALERLL